MVECGGSGGFLGGRELDKDNPWEQVLEQTFGERLRADRDFGTRLWGSLANKEWRGPDGCLAHCSFRRVGDIIAAIIGEGDYLAWYCSGDAAAPADPEVIRALKVWGWTAHDWIPA